MDSGIAGSDLLKVLGQLSRELLSFFVVLYIQCYRMYGYLLMSHNPDKVKRWAQEKGHCKNVALCAYIAGRQAT